MNGWSWLMLHNFLNLLKQATSGLSELPAPMPLAKWPDTSSSQPKFIAFLYLGISKPSIRTAISDCFITQAGWPWTKHRWGMTLAYTSQETPEPAHPVDSYRPYQGTTLFPHS